MADDREYSNIYTIPPNYTDSGKLLGGLLEVRNTVEAGVRGLPGADVAASACYRKSDGDDSHAAAAGHIRTDGVGRRFAAPVCCAHRLVLDTAQDTSL